MGPDPVVVTAKDRLRASILYKRPAESPSTESGLGQQVGSLKWMTPVLDRCPVQATTAAKTVPK